MSVVWREAERDNAVFPAEIDEGDRFVGGVAIKQKNTVLALAFVNGMLLKMLQPLQRDRIVCTV